MKKYPHWIENYHYLCKRIRIKVFTKILTPCFHSVGQNISIIPPLRFSNIQYAELGNYVTIHSNCWINVLSGEDDSNHPKLIIKDHVGIGMNSTISVAKKVFIDEYVFLARNVFISDHGHEYSDVQRPISFQGIGCIKEVNIGAHSWLGQNTVILPGVNIGKHCVIGANSVVNRDIPDYHVAAGAPAVPIRIYDAVTDSWKRIDEI
jgi:acetyltransferase-like isoleucine patch superfamily enzyme